MARARDHDTNDRATKWLIPHFGDAILRLAGVRGIRSWKALQNDLGQPRRLPDGLLEVLLEGILDPRYYLLEVATYPEDRVLEQMLRGAMLVWLDKGIVPELLTLVLCQRGRKRVPPTHSVASAAGTTRLQIEWPVVELWNLPAEAMLEANDVGLIPWVPLMKFEGSPELLLKECRLRIVRQAPPTVQENLLVVTQVLASLRYNGDVVAGIFGGPQAMLRIPLLDKLVNDAVSDRIQRTILRLLEHRLGTVPEDLALTLQHVQGEDALDTLLRHAGLCADFEEFRTRLAAIAKPRRAKRAR